MKLNRTLLIVVCICLVPLVLTPLIYWKMVQEGQSFREPINKYSSNSYHMRYDNETLSEVWNRTKNLKQVSDFSRYGNYSVLMSFHAYGGGYCEWFIVASTLQPDAEGVIHELVVRFDASNYYDMADIIFIKSYEDANSFNLTSYEDGSQVITGFLNQHESFSYRSYPTPPCSLYFPFLLLFDYAGDVGETIILNLNTGRTMIAASSVWMGTGDLVYPEFMQNVGE